MELPQLFYQICDHSFFGVFLTLFCYLIGLWIYERTRFALLHPVLIAVILIGGILIYFHIPLESYDKGGDLITLFLSPVTAVLAYEIYRQRKTLASYFLPVIVGCAVGSGVSLFSVTLFCRLFGLSEEITASILAKSVTTPIAVEITGMIGGIPSLTVVVVVLTGIMGAVLSPVLIKLFHIKSKVAAGVAIGTCSHAIGTSKAIELGQTQGAMSGISIGISGIVTVAFVMIMAALL